MQKRITNLFTFGMQKKLPAILPEVMKPVEYEINDEVIKQHYAEMGFSLETMIKIIQP